MTGRAIFVVTVFGDVVDRHPRRQRTWGWYEKLKDAQRAVLENHTDMYETLYYDVAVIEEVQEGILAENRRAAGTELRQARERVMTLGSVPW